jgi:hypothetical protein
MLILDAIDVANRAFVSLNQIDFSKDARIKALLCKDCTVPSAIPRVYQKPLDGTGLAFAEIILFFDA